MLYGTHVLKKICPHVWGLGEGDHFYQTIIVSVPFSPQFLNMHAGTTKLPSRPRPISFFARGSTKSWKESFFDFSPSGVRKIDFHRGISKPWKRACARVFLAFFCLLRFSSLTAGATPPWPWCPTGAVSYSSSALAQWHIYSRRKVGEFKKNVPLSWSLFHLKIID